MTEQSDPAAAEPGARSNAPAMYRLFGVSRTRRSHLLQVAAAASLVTLLLAGLAVLAQPAAGPSTAETGCRRIALRPQPSWTESAAWSPGGRNLVVVDIMANKALRYARSGRSLGTLPAPVEEMLERFRPVRIQNEDSSFVVELADARFMRLDEDYQPQEAVDLPRDAVGEEWRVIYLFQWAPVGRDILGYGDLVPTEGEGGRSGFVRVPLDEPSRFQVPRDLSPDDAVTRKLYRLGYPYFTSLGSTGVILAMYEEPRILLHDPGEGGVRELDAFPAGLKRRPFIEHEFERPTDFPLVMADVEHATMPAGIYGWNGDLYVLQRRPGEDGTVWSLTKIDPDPDTDAVVGTTTLNTSANHLTVVPGPEDWAFIEKGPVEALGKQNVESVLLVPSERIASLTGGRELCPELQ